MGKAVTSCHMVRNKQAKRKKGKQHRGEIQEEIQRKLSTNADVVAAA